LGFPRPHVLLSVCRRVLQLALYNRRIEFAQADSIDKRRDICSSPARYASAQTRICAYKRKRALRLNGVEPRETGVGAERRRLDEGLDDRACQCAATYLDAESVAVDR